MSLLICYGTRAEYIKIKPLIDNLKCKILFTGQHMDIIFDNKYDYLISIEDNNDNRKKNIIYNIMNKCDKIIKLFDYVLVQGDTTSAFAIALTTHMCKKKLIHLEAGLRTHNMHNPYPEELNRVLISQLADIHFCPTIDDYNNLKYENITKNVYIVGNTVYDYLTKDGNCYSDIVLITLHRSDNIKYMNKYFKIINNIAINNPSLCFIFPMHLNKKITRHKHILKNIIILNPLSRDDMLNYVKICKFIITDSGGLQEEAVFFNKRTIICRKNTERKFTLKCGAILCKKYNCLENIFNIVNKNYIYNTDYSLEKGKSWTKIKSILTYHQVDV